MKMTLSTPVSAPSRTFGLLAALAIVGSLSLGACNRHEDPAETAKDMGEARREGTENVRDAAKDLAEDQAEGASVKEAVTDAYKVELEKIRADYEVAKERCDGVADADKDKCRNDAESAYESAKKALDARRDHLVDQQQSTGPTGNR